MNQSQPTIGFIGVGRLGRALALAMDRHGYQVRALHSRTMATAEAAAAHLQGCRVYDHPQALCDAVDLVFITTPDRAIEPLAARLQWRRGQAVVHCCGALGPAALAPAAAQGALTGAFHPCQTFAGAGAGAGPPHQPAHQAVELLKGVTFAVAADGWLLDFLNDLACRLGGSPIAVADDQRPLYHASGVLACGHLTALLQGAVDIWVGMGFTPERAMEALYPLARATLQNALNLGLPASATGPVIRGDAATVETHLNALAGSHPHLVSAYASLARASLLSLPPAQTRASLPDGQTQESPAPTSAPLPGAQAPESPAPDTPAGNSDEQAGESIRDLLDRFWPDPVERPP